MKALFVVLVTMLSVGCGEVFVNEKAPAEAHNTSNRNMILIVGTREIPMAPNSQFRFTIDIMLATPRDFGGNSPSPVDQHTQVVVKWRDAWTMQTTEAYTCNAGAKFTTVFIYTLNGNFQSHRCEYLRTY